MTFVILFLEQEIIFTNIFSLLISFPINQLCCHSPKSNYIKNKLFFYRSLLKSNHSCSFCIVKILLTLGIYGCEVIKHSELNFRQTHVIPQLLTMRIR